MKAIYEVIQLFILLVICFELALFITPTIFKILSFIVKKYHRHKMLYSGAKSVIKFRKTINSNISDSFKNIFTEGFNFNFVSRKKEFYQKKSY